MKATRNKRGHKIRLKLLALLCAAAIILPGSAIPTAYAAENKASLTVSWKESGNELALYKVAARNSEGGYEITEDFRKYNVEILGIKDDKLENAAELLASYAVRDGLEPLKQITTDSSGEYIFKDLDFGAYMVFDKSSVEGSKTTAVPVFVFLEKDMKVVIKPAADKSTSCEVYKIWDDGEDNNRPDKVEIQLLNGEGKVCKEETLSKENNWHCSWTDLPEDKYRVVEKEIPSGYKLTASRRGDTWKLTNQKKDSTPGDGEKKDSGGGSSGSSGGSGGGSKSIPKTGQLWWPVPLLLSAGFLCMIIGLIRSRKQEDKEQI